MRTILLSVLLTAFLTLGCGGGEPAAEAPGAAPAETAKDFFQVDLATAATVTGKINFEGEKPKPVRLNMSAEPGCRDMHDGPVYANAIAVNDDNTLANVYVYVKSGLEGKSFAPPKDKVVIDQKGCVYIPRVVGVQIGQTLSVLNSDSTSHNVHPLPRSNVEWNKSQAVGAGPIEQTFKKPELMIPVKCNLHPWMRAYVNVSDHPFFAVTGADGSFEIAGLPPGDYTLEAVHERLGNQEIQMTLGDGESKAVELTYSN